MLSMYFALSLPFLKILLTVHAALKNGHVLFVPSYLLENVILYMPVLRVLGAHVVIHGEFLNV